MSIRRILIVDDSPTERYFLSQVLTKAGYEVLVATDGSEAFALARDQRPDLIIMDVVMPGMNGFQTTRGLHKDPETAQIPVILCTSKGDPTDKIWGLRQGARDYLVKPVKPEELLAKIASIGAGQ